jgi:ribonuclease-3
VSSAGGAPGSRQPEPAARPESEDTKREKDRLGRIERALGHRFVRRELLETALRHASYTHEHPELECNERLEFLGDAVLALVVANSLFRSKPEWREGALTRALHSIVEGRSLARLARELEVGPALALGRTERRSQGEKKPSILANAVEALIGALYLDGGLPVATGFIERAFAEALAADAAPVGRDPKTELQERTMARVGEFPRYRVVADNAVEGHEERFRVEVTLRERALAEGVGRTKRAAERRAARTALESWRDEDE